MKSLKNLLLKRLLKVTSALTQPEGEKRLGNITLDVLRSVSSGFGYCLRRAFPRMNGIRGPCTTVYSISPWIPRTLALVAMSAFLSITRGLWCIYSPVMLEEVYDRRF